MVFPLAVEALQDPETPGGLRDGSPFLGPHGWRLGATLVRNKTRFTVYIYAKLVRAWPSVYLRSATYRCGTGHTSTELKTAKLKSCFLVITSSTISTRCGERSSKRLLHIYFCVCFRSLFFEIFFFGVV